VPHPLRAPYGGSVYERGGFWRRTGSVEFGLRIARRLATMSKLSASIAQHAMLGIGLNARSEQLEA
jgi:hypothetical protein